MRRMTLIRGTARTSVMDVTSARDANAITSVLNRSVAHDRVRILVSIGTGGIYQDAGTGWVRHPHRERRN